MSLEWHEIRGGYQVATDGEKIFAVIAKPEGAPIEMFQIQYFENCFSAIGAAMAEVEKDHAAFSQRTMRQPESFGETMLTVLKQLVTSMEDAKSKRLTAA